MVLSEKVAETLKEVLDYPLQVSQNAFVYAEAVTGELVYEGMGEFRDAITHISRALWIADEEEALRNLDEALNTSGEQVLKALSGQPQDSSNMSRG
ncbi:MAG: hypothetical protein HXS52_03045 [Theionarchaea archaeon]|nr:hypothetical protein [Theionarchaea archaeon]MBU7036883.1 hypothetical protein [Theionarchaea archaeon]